MTTDIKSKLKLAWEYPPIWSIAQLASKAGFGVIVVPYLARYLDQGQIAIWYSFVALGSIGSVLEMGLSTVLSRLFGVIAKNENPSSHNEQFHQLIQINFDDAFGTARKVYKTAAAILYLLLQLGGLLYLLGIPQISISDKIYWSIYSVSWYIGLRQGVWVPLLIGNGMITKVYRGSAIAFSVGLAVTMVSINFTQTLLAPVLGMVTVNLLSRSTLIGAIQPLTRKVSACRFSKKVWLNIRGVIFKNLLVLFSGFLVYQSGLLIVVRSLPREEAASYGFSMQICQFLGAIYIAIVNAHLPQYLDFRLGGKINLLAKYATRLVGITLTLFAFSASLLAIWIGKARVLHPEAINFVDSNAMLFMLFTQLLETHHVMCGVIFGTTNQIKMVHLSVIGGLSLLASNTIAAQMAGVEGVIASQFLSQLIFNNWWPPLLFARSVKSTYLKIITKTIFLPIIIFGIGSVILHL